MECVTVITKVHCGTAQSANQMKVNGVSTKKKWTHDYISTYWYSRINWSILACAN